jgi:hypothetical protein
MALLNAVTAKGVKEEATEGKKSDNESKDKEHKLKEKELSIKEKESEAKKGPSGDEIADSLIKKFNSQ